ncbi:MAG: response regulator [Rhodothermaceae bacterium]|nr:response regulator [Rhodothermaceae bacterium]
MTAKDIQSENHVLSVLVVDDEEDVQWLFKQQFRREIRSGLLNLHFAFSGEEALSFMQSGGDAHIVLVFSDINMPGMTGLDLLKHLREQYTELPIHMITAYGDDENYNQAMNFGASGYLTKPIDFSVLKNLILDITP